MTENHHNPHEERAEDKRGTKPDRRAVNRMDGYNDRRKVENDTLTPTPAAEKKKTRLDSPGNERPDTSEASVITKDSGWYDVE